MYLIRGDLGCMLFTGDFRWELGCEEARSAKKALLQALAGDSVDVLYMDNTYCHPTLNFPPRRVVAEQVWFASIDCASFCAVYIGPMVAV
jgi:DNA cross-link repair 1B protein